jgi:hypothetical protein
MTDYHAHIDTPEGRLDDLGPMATPSALAGLVAKGLQAVERKGSRGTPRAYVLDGGTELDLTPDDQEAFDTALEQELREARGR